MKALTKLDRTIDDERIASLGKVVHDSGKSPNKACIVIRHFHGNAPHVDKILSNPEFAQLFLEHQNRVRILCALMLEASDDSQFFLEGRTADGIRGDQYFQRAFQIEQEFGDTSEYDDTVKEILGVSKIFSPSKLRKQKGIGRCFMSKSMDQLLGSFRQAGALIQRGQPHKVHGIERSTKEPFCSSISDPWDLLFQGFEPIMQAVNEVKHRNLVAGIRDIIVHNALGVAVIGASHTKSGSEAPYQACQYLEDQIPEDLPNTRLVVIEPIGTDQLLK